MDDEAPPPWTTPADVLAYWFGPSALSTDFGAMTLSTQQYFDARVSAGVWRIPDLDKPVPAEGDPVRAAEDAQDAFVKQAAGALIQKAAKGELKGAQWTGGATGVLAQILLTSVLSRMAFRGLDERFAGDETGLALALSFYDSAARKAASPLERMWAYVPFMRAEDREVQEMSVDLYQELDRELVEQGCGCGKQMLKLAFDTHGVLKKWAGTFPHLNDSKDRDTDEDEHAWLISPGGKAFVHQA